jgi:hypothetical protein
MIMEHFVHHISHTEWTGAEPGERPATTALPMARPIKWHPKILVLITALRAGSEYVVATSGRVQSLAEFLLKPVIPSTCLYERNDSRTAERF